MTYHDIPLLEFDPCPASVIMPDHERLPLSLPPRAVFAFLGERIDEYAAKTGAERVSHFRSATKDFPIYVCRWKGEPIVLCQAPVGAAAAAQLMDWLIAYGVKSIISAGSCGVLDPLPENAFLIPARALRDEGTSYHYAPPSRFMEISAAARAAIERAIAENGLQYQEVTTWSTDGFFRETREKVARRKAEGCAVVEMECSALAACAALRGVQWGMILYTADSLADPDRYDERDWGGTAADYALHLCLEAVIRL